MHIAVVEQHQLASPRPTAWVGALAPERQFYFAGYYYPAPNRPTCAARDRR